MSMRPYIVLSPGGGTPSRRIAYQDIARLFAEEDAQDEPVPPPNFRERLAAAWQNAMAPLREIALLLAEEHRARQLEMRGARG
jgi:hypothetical protein